MCIRDRSWFLYCGAAALSLVAGSARFVRKGIGMLTLYFTPGACSMAAHIVLEESGEKYEPQRVDLSKGEQRSEAYLKVNPLGRVPALRLENGEPLAENTAILPYLGKRFGLWPICLLYTSPSPRDRP